MRNKILLLMLLSIVVYAKDVQMVFFYSTPPYVFKDGSGIEMDLVKKSLSYTKHTVSPLFVTIGRGTKIFQDNYVDAIAVIQKSSGLKGYYSDYFMQYHNFAFALSSNHYKITKLADLGKYNFSSFQNATIYLGKEFANAAKIANKNYSEIADQELQVYKLLKGRTQVTVMDKYIFQYYKNKLIKDGKIDKNIKIDQFNLLEPTKYRAAFKDKKVRDDFNKGIQYLKVNRLYDEIYEKYSNKFFRIKK